MISVPTNGEMFFGLRVLSKPKQMGMDKQRFAPTLPASFRVFFYVKTLTQTRWRGSSKMMGGIQP